MSDSIALLERLACTPYLDDAGFDALAEALPSEAAIAIRSGEARHLARLLGANEALACFILAPDQEQPSPDDRPAEDEPQPADVPGESGT